MSSTPPAARLFRRVIAVLLCLGGLMAVAIGSAAAATGPRIDILELTGVLDGPLARFAADVVEEANTAGSELVVIHLDSAGALRGAAEDIADTVTASAVPVAVWVGPPGARATGGAYLVAAAAHALGVAPGVVIGGAVPADLTDIGAPVEDVAARLAGYAAQRGRDADFAAAAALEGAAVAVVPTGGVLGEAPEIPPSLDPDAVRPLDEAAVVASGVADLVALSLPDLLRDLDRHTVTIGGTATVLDLDPAAAAVRYHNPGLVRRLLHAIADPTLAYLLVMGGALALLFEVFQPGFGVAGVSGIPVLGLGAYGLWVLPANWFGAALIVAGLLLLAGDLAIGGLGMVTVGGTASLAAGSLLLFRGPPPMQLSGWLIATVVAFCVVFFVAVMTTVLRAQSAQLPAPPAELMGKIGVVRSMLNPEGHVFVEGSLWRARAPEGSGKVRTGTKVQVIDVGENATLTVTVPPADSPSN